MAEDEENQAKQFKMSDDQGNDVTHWRSFNSKGSAQYTNGDKYDGDFAKGRRHGTGTMVYQNSDVYEGQWCENQKHGNYYSWLIPEKTFRIWSINITKKTSYFFY